MERCIVGIGEALWDCLPEGRKIGGAPANFAYHMNRFGFDSIVISAVGEDDLGKEIKDVFNHKDLQFLLETTPYPTGTVQVELDENGIPTYDIKENVAWDNISFSPQMETIARKCDVVCFGSLAQRNHVSRDTLRRFLQAMPDNDNTYRIFDINLRQHYYDMDIISESLLACNVFKINDDELAVLKRLFGYEGLSDDDVCARMIRDWKLKILILTCGTDGSKVFTPDEMSLMDTPTVHVADTVGAGDSFTAAFIASILRGLTIKDAHKTAVFVSAYVCTCYGAMPEMPQEYTSFEL